MSDDFHTVNGDRLDVSFSNGSHVSSAVAEAVSEAVGERYGVDPSRVSVLHAHADKSGVSADVIVNLPPEADP